MNADFVASVQKSCRDIHAAAEALRRLIETSDRAMRLCNACPPSPAGGAEWERLLHCRSRLRGIERHLAGAEDLTMRLYFECLAEEAPID